MPNPIDANEKLAVAVGRATSTWAHAELHLTSVFSTLTGMDFTMAATVFRFFRNTPTQREALLQVATVSTRCDEADYATLSAILTEYANLAGRRNRVAHEPFGWEAGSEEKIYRMQKEKVSKPGMFPFSRAPVDVAEIEALADEIWALVERMVRFGNELQEKVMAEKPDDGPESPPSGGLLSDD